MTRPDSIRTKGLEAHVNQHCLAHSLPMRYKNLVDFITAAEALGEQPSPIKLARAFGVTRPTMEKWLAIYKEEHPDVRTT